MFCLALTLRDRLVGDVPDDVLEERVLTSLGRAGIGLDREHLLAEQGSQQGLEVGLGQAGERSDTLPREHLAEHRAVLDEAALLGREPVEPRSDERLQRLRYLERLDRSGRVEDAPV